MQQVMAVKKSFKILWSAVALVVVLAGIVLATLLTPTPALSKKSVDFLNVIRALSALKGRVEMQKSGAEGAIPFPDLNEVEVRQIVQQSDGLIRQVKLRPDGAIVVQASIASSQQVGSDKRAEVNLLLVPEKAEKGYDWRCFGAPISNLPTFCEQLK